MFIWVLGIIFFIITFSPRFFQLMNFRFGFLDLGLSSQILGALSHFTFNPIIPTYAKHYFQVRQQPIFLFLLPMSLISISPVILLFIDEIALFLAAGFVARFARLRFQERSWAGFFLFATLFSNVLMRSLHDPGRPLLWATFPLTLLLIEFFQKRRTGFLALWAWFLCLCDLHFLIFTGVLALLSLFTEKKRWKLSRRLVSFLALFLVSALSFGILKAMGGVLARSGELFIQRDLVILGFSFGFLFFFVPEISVLAVALVLTKFGYLGVEPALFVPLAGIGTIEALSRIGPRLRPFYGIVKVWLVGAALFYNLIGLDPFFEFWRYENRTVTPPSQGVHQLMVKIPQDSFMAVSDTLTPHFGYSSQMISLKATGPFGVQPQYVLIVNDPALWEKNPLYRLIDTNQESGARLFTRIR